MHRLSSSFVLGYHGCDKNDGERILRGETFRASSNDYDWLGTGIYFWEANPERALEFAVEKSRRAWSNIRTPFAIGAVIELGLCLDLASKQSLELLRESYESLRQRHMDGGTPLPRNGKKFWQRYLDCAVINHLHSTLAAGGLTHHRYGKGHLHRRRTNLSRSRFPRKNPYSDSSSQSAVH